MPIKFSSEAYFFRLEVQDFYVLKNPSTSAGFEPANLGSRGEHVTSRPPRPTGKDVTIEPIGRSSLNINI